jgi:hypothetical protein
MAGQLAREVAWSKSVRVTEHGTESNQQITFEVSGSTNHNVLHVLII